MLTKVCFYLFVSCLENGLASKFKHIWDHFGDLLSFQQAPTTGQNFHDIIAPQKMKHNDLSDPLTFLIAPL